MNPVSGPDYAAIRADMRLLRDGREIAALHPERRTFPNGTATHVAIRTNLLADVYAVIGEAEGNGAYVAAPLLQPAGAVDLARRGRDGVGRAGLAVRPAAPDRRPGAAGAAGRCGGSGPGGRMNASADR